MKSIENRLTAVEKISAKTENVTATYRDNTESEMDLLKAVRLLLSGEVRVITRPWKHGEWEAHATGVARDIELMLNELRNEKRAGQQFITELFDCLEAGTMPPNEVIKTGRDTLIKLL